MLPAELKLNVWCAATPSPGGDEHAAVLPEALHRHLAEGATMVLNAVDELHPDTEHTAADLERLFRTVVRTNLYASWIATEGFGLHFDDHDVLVVQLSGRKRWRFHPPTRAAAMLHDVVTPPRPTGEPYADTVLGEGDVLFLPRGWWHGASAGEGTQAGSARGRCRYRLSGSARARSS
ncbi:JmjC domain-containing protein [Streptomyces fulvoviolaceus]|uniref:JmjC domain-containing protein n=1 Tax=Streptomyces fulvoviolaceus TaxID=285535 RepID=UPI0006947535|nr:cupin domain-containing protein [Streptomyces fulvoviolaceus]